MTSARKFVLWVLKNIRSLVLNHPVVEYLSYTILMNTVVPVFLLLTQLTVDFLPVNQLKGFQRM